MLTFLRFHFYLFKPYSHLLIRFSSFVFLFLIICIFPGLIIYPLLNCSLRLQVQTLGNIQQTRKGMHLIDLKPSNFCRVLHGKPVFNAVFPSFKIPCVSCAWIESTNHFLQS